MVDGSFTARAPEYMTFRNATSLSVTIPFHFRLKYINSSVLETFKSTKSRNSGH